MDAFEWDSDLDTFLVLCPFVVVNNNRHFLELGAEVHLMERLKSNLERSRVMRLCCFSRVIQSVEKTCLIVLQILRA